jgi:hypothetical protein
MEPDTARRLQVKYRIKLPGAARGWPGVNIQRGQTPERDEKMDQLDQIRALASEAGAPEGDVVEAVRWLVGENARLAPLADEGRQYREDLITDALAEGVRAMGENFPAETYRQMFNRAGLEEIKLLRSKWQEQAALRFPGGRKSEDEERQPVQPERARKVPKAAYRN